MADTGVTQINDIVLDIPPESIQVSRRSFNHEWQTLRTRSSIKVKSGFSALDVTMTCQFTDDPIEFQGGTVINGFSKLRMLISQFRVTPFCYIENQFLRNSILGGSKDQSMALVMKQIEVSKSDRTTNVVTVTMHFCWFNYFPFTKNFSFKRDIFVGDEVTNPRDSNAWKIMYLAEQARTKYAPVSSLRTSTKLEFNEFSNIEVKRYAEIQEDVKLVEDIKRKLISSGGNDVGDTLKLITDSVNKAITDKNRAGAVIREFFGDTTTMVGSFDVDGPSESDIKREVLRLIDSNLSSAKYDIVKNTEWRPVIMQDNKRIRFRNEPAAKANDLEHFDRSDLILMTRKRSMDVEGSGLVTTGVTISFENILSTLPMIGHPYPTYQHVGSIDARVALQFITTSEFSVRQLSNLYTVLEDQARKFRLIPQGKRNLSIENDLVNMCGIKETIPDSLIIETVEGSPGTYAAVLTLANNPIEADTQEQFSQEGAFTTDNELRLKIAHLFESKLKLITDAFQVGTEGVILRDRKTPDIKYVRQGTEEVRGSGATHIESVSVEGTGEPSYYLYMGSKEKEQQVFRSLCEDYAKGLGALLAKIFPVILALKANPKKDERAEDFFVLTDRDVFGIEKIKEDIIAVVTNQGEGREFERLHDSPFAVISGSTFNSKALEKRASLADTTSRAESQKFFKLYNEWKDSHPTSSKNEEILPENIDDSPLASFQDADRIRSVLNAYFNDWLTTATALLDKVLYAGFIDMPEFDEIKKLLHDRALKSSVSNYPDFPLTEVIGLLQTAKGGNLRHSFRRLQDLFEKSNGSLKSFGLVTMINPDFYFFNPQNDVKESIVSTEAMRTAAKGIIKGRESMIEEERDWFKGVYAEQIIGPKKAELAGRVTQASQLSEQFKAIAASVSGGKYQDDVNSKIAADGLAPNELVGTVGPAIIESSKLGEPKSKKPNSITIAAFKEGNDGPDPNKSVQKYGGLNLRTNYNDQVTMSLPDSAYAVRHRFDTEDCLSNLPEVAYIPVDDDPNSLPPLFWPVEGHVRTSPFVPNPPGRRHPTLKEKDGSPVVRAHKGLDLVPRGRNTPGTPVTAAAAGNVIFAKYDAKSIFGLIKMQHNGGLVTWYMHVAADGWSKSGDEAAPAPRGTFRYWRNLLEGEGEFANLDSKTRAALLFVKEKEQIATIAETPPVASGPHLHFETHLNGTEVDPELFFNGEIYKSKGHIKGIEPQNDSLLSKSIEQLEKDLYTGQGFTMMRAYPTFKLFFVESDDNAQERKVLGFDDFFSYSSIKEIQVIRSRKIAADLCTIQLTNISGRLSNRKFQSSMHPTQAKGADQQDAKEHEQTAQRTNTVNENPIASLMLQPGIQIQLRLGYSNNPEELEIVFNGLITDVEFTDTDDLVQIVAQSYAVELVQNIQGEVKGFGGFADGDGRTFKILEELMSFPEVVHFGRWVRNEIGKNNNRGLLTNRWRLIPTPEDDNIFPPMGQTSLGIIDEIVSTTKYQMYQTTIWDVFQEMTLRHPSYVACAVPYEGKFGNPRMTMFFGLPDQMYFARDSTPAEDNVVNTLRDVVKQGFTDEAGQVAVAKLRDAGVPLASDDLEAILDEDLEKKVASERDRWFQLKYKQYAKNRGYIRPFRNYHSLTSSMHIMYNSISSSSHNTFNTATIQYGEGSAEADEDTGTLNFDNAETFTLRADEAIPDEETREVFAQYPNCVGYEMAKRYAMGVLYYSLKEAYKGSLVVIGNPKIKPYDICYIFDEYTDMYGPIEVEQVVHRFSQETGFITEITPDMVVHVNQHATLSTNDAMGLICEHAMKSIDMPSLPSIVGTLAGNAGGAALSAVGTTAGQGALASGLSSAAGGALSAGVAVEGATLGVASALGSEAAIGVGAVAVDALGGAAVALEAGAVGVAAAPVVPIIAGAVILNFAFSPIAAMFFNSDINSLGEEGGSTALGMIGTFIFRKWITRTQLAHPFRFSPLTLGGKPMVGGLPNRRSNGTFVQRMNKWTKDAGDGIGLIIDDTIDRLHPNNWLGNLGEGDLNTLLKGTD